MRAADWIGRAIYLLSLIALNEVHAMFFGDPESNQLSVAIYVCTAAACNTFAVFLAPDLLKGKTIYDMQRLAYCAIVVNFLSFIAYSAEISPIVFNTTITVLSYVQLVRLLWPSNGNFSHNHRRFGFLRFAAIQSKDIHMEAQK